jgi:hypothetical protein
MKATSFVLFSALIACSGASPGEPSDSTASEVTAKAKPGIGDEGGPCGGIAGVSCKDGLVCEWTMDVPEPYSTCIRPGIGDEGGPCGGIAGVSCKEGLVCKWTMDVPVPFSTCVPDDGSASAE